MLRGHRATTETLLWPDSVLGREKLVSCCKPKKTNSYNNVSLCYSLSPHGSATTDLVTSWGLFILAPHRRDCVHCGCLHRYVLIKVCGLSARRPSLLEMLALTDDAACTIRAPSLPAVGSPGLSVFDDADRRLVSLHLSERYIADWRVCVCVCFRFINCFCCWGSN